MIELNFISCLYDNYQKLGNGDILEKLISSYEQVGDGSVLEDVLFAKYQNSVSYLERVEKEIASNPDFGKLSINCLLRHVLSFPAWLN